MKVLSLRSKITIHPDVISKTVQGEEVLLNLSTGTYYGLNSVGTEIWKSLKKKKKPQAIVNHLVSSYPISKEEAQKDLISLLKQLHKSKLITCD